VGLRRRAAAAEARERSDQEQAAGEHASVKRASHRACSDFRVRSAVEDRQIEIAEQLGVVHDVDPGDFPLREREAEHPEEIAGSVKFEARADNR
jgi:hypothetical protein